MAGRSSIATRPAEIRAEVDGAIKRGATIDRIVEMLRGLGQPVSRSAVGRYSKDYAELAAQQRDLQATARAFASEFGEADDKQSRLLIQLVTSIATKAVMPLAANEDPEVDGKELHYLARAVKDITSAAKTDVDREAKIREEATKQAAAEMRRKLDAGAKSGELDPAALARAKRILGFE